jgi:pilus assembly protein CpaB
LQNVLVLAAGQLFTRPEERSVQSRTVTLALKPSEVDILVVARGRGALSLALRGVNDHDVVSRVPEKPAIDPEHEKQLKLEQEQRSRLEEELRRMKEMLAKKPPAEPPPVEKPHRAPRVATIYRGGAQTQTPQRIRTDIASSAELEPPEPLAFPVGTARGAQVASSGPRGTNGDVQPQP